MNGKTRWGDRRVLRRILHRRYVSARLSYGRGVHVDVWRIYIEVVTLGEPFAGGVIDYENDSLLFTDIAV